MYLLFSQKNVIAIFSKTRGIKCTYGNVCVWSFIMCAKKLKQKNEFGSCQLLLWSSTDWPFLNPPCILEAIFFYPPCIEAIWKNPSHILSKILSKNAKKKSKADDPKKSKILKGEMYNCKRENENERHERFYLKNEYKDITKSDVLYWKNLKIWFSKKYCVYVTIPQCFRPFSSQIDDKNLNVIAKYCEKFSRLFLPSLLTHTIGWVFFSWSQ